MGSTADAPVGISACTRVGSGKGAVVVSATGAAVREVMGAGLGKAEISNVGFGEGVTVATPVVPFREWAQG